MINKSFLNMVYESLIWIYKFIYNLIYNIYIKSYSFLENFGLDYE